MADPIRHCAGQGAEAGVSHPPLVLIVTARGGREPALLLWLSEEENPESEVLFSFWGSPHRPQLICVIAFCTPCAARIVVQSQPLVVLHYTAQGAQSPLAGSPWPTGKWLQQTGLFQVRGIPAVLSLILVEHLPPVLLACNTAG